VFLEPLAVDLEGLGVADRRDGGGRGCPGEHGELAGPAPGPSSPSPCGVLPLRATRSRRGVDMQAVAALPREEPLRAGPAPTRRLGNSSSGAAAGAEESVRQRRPSIVSVAILSDLQEDRPVSATAGRASSSYRFEIVRRQVLNDTCSGRCCPCQT
jgi:hypothetical protein